MHCKLENCLELRRMDRDWLHIPGIAVHSHECGESGGHRYHQMLSFLATDAFQGL